MTGPEPHPTPRSSRGPALLALVGVSVFSLLALFFLVLTKTAPAQAAEGRSQSSAPAFQAPLDELDLLKTASTTTPAIGEEFTYTIVITNPTGVSITTPFNVIDIPDGDLMILGGEAPGNTTFNNNIWIIDSLDSGSSLTLILDAVIESANIGEDVSNSVQIETATSVSDIETVRVTGVADLEVDKTASAASVLAGGDLSYTITVINTGSAAAEGVIITDTLPAALENLDFNLDPDTSAGGVLTWNLDDPLDHDESVTIVITGTVNANAPTNQPLVNRANARTSTHELVLQNNSAEVETAVQQLRADLELSKEVNLTRPHELEEIVYTLTLENNGPNTVTQFTVTDTLPVGLTFIEADAEVGSFQSSTWSASNANLGAGDAITLTLTARPNRGTDGQNLVNRAAITNSTPTDPNSNNNQASAPAVIPAVTTIVDVNVVDGSSRPVVGATVVLTDTVGEVFSARTDNNGLAVLSSTSMKPMAGGGAVVEVSMPGAYLPEEAAVSVIAGGVVELEVTLTRTTNLSVTKNDNATTVSRGASLDYNVRITNNGTINATNIVITDTFGAGLSFDSFITNTITSNPSGLNLDLVDSLNTNTRRVWRMTGSLAPNQSYQFIVRADVADNATGSMTNRVDISTASPEANRNNNSGTDTTNLSGTSTTNLAITKSASPQEVRPGQNIVFRIDIENNTNSSIRITEIFDAVPAGFEAISASLGGADVVDDIDPVVNQSTRNVTVAEDFTLDPGDEVQLAISARVSASASATTTGSNTVRVSIQGGGNRTASASYRIVAQGTLPGTGFGPPGGFSLSRFSPGFAAGPHPHLFARAGARIALQAASGPGQRASLIAFLAALLLGSAGAAALVYGLRGRGRGSEWGPYAARMGMVFAGLALVFALAGLWLSGYPGRSETPAAGEPGPEQAQEPLALATVEVWLPPSVPEDDLPSLPDFPIPTPQVSPTPGEEAPDSSPVVRISIPAIGVNNEVKYVPFDGLSWMIGGLRQEVAWLGETSWPGLGGNTALAAHVNLRGGDNGPFRYLEDLIEGDVVRVYTEQNVYEYRVRARRVVDETDVSVVQATGAPQLTLITCTGWDPDVSFYLQRTVVFADLVEVAPRSGQVSSQ